MPPSHSLKQYQLKDKDQVVVVFSKRQYKAPENVERLVVGGIDLTDIKEFGHLLKKKDTQYIQEAQLPSIVGMALPPGQAQNQMQ